MSPVLHVLEGSEIGWRLTPGAELLLWQKGDLTY